MGFVVGVVRLKGGRGGCPTVWMSSLTAMVSYDGSNGLTKVSIFNGIRKEFVSFFLLSTEFIFQSSYGLGNMVKCMQNQGASNVRREGLGTTINYFLVVQH